VRSRVHLTDHGANILVWSKNMNMRNFPTLPSAQEGKVGYILLWLVGVPIPILFLIFLLRGCT
jgi:hypothetical protein